MAVPELGGLDEFDAKEFNPGMEMRTEGKDMGQEAASREEVDELLKALKSAE